MEIICLILAAFATYRLAILFSDDDGPMFIFKRLRDYTGHKSGAQMLRDKEYGFWVSLNEGLSCPLCTGLYAAVLCMLLLFFPTVGGDIFLIIFALAGAQTVLQKVTS